MPITAKTLRSLVLPLAFSLVGSEPTGAGLAATPATVAIRLDDSRLQSRFSEAREFRLTKVCYIRNTFVVGNRDIGPAGVRHTLASMEFPWRHPGGRFQDGFTRKLVWPADVKARKNLRVRVKGRGRLFDRPTWQWPKETTFFELHFHPGGWPFELRVLDKVGDGYGFDNYEIHVFRPYSHPQDLPFAAPHVHRHVSIDSNHPYQPFRAKAVVAEYRDVDADWAKLVTSRVWADDTGHEWHHTGLGHKWLSPRGYAGWMTGSTHESCAKCHENSGTTVDAFDPVRDWYGFIPGGDGVFSFDPIDRRSVSHLGPHGRGFRWRNN